MYHEPVMLKESIDGLNLRPEGTYVDATFGGGGHSCAILEKLQDGKIIAFDMDEDAKKNAPKDERFTLINHNFRYMRNFLRYMKIEKVDGILADLGISSHQIDERKRGFTFMHQTNLDMRMDKHAETDAIDILNNYEQQQLANIFFEFGEIHNSKKLAKSIVSARKSKRINTTSDLKEAAINCIPKNNENKYLAKLFQALRIEVNKELDSLRELLMQSTEILEKNSRLVIITYHSLEDRLVKNFIKQGKFSGQAEKDLYGNIDVPFKAVNRKVITPSEEELKRNRRSRSAKLRIAKRI